jgi:DNA polymerase III alpha subunit
MPYVPLRVRSNHSLLAGASSVSALVSKAARHGLPMLALTDENNLYGAVAFFQQAREQGVRPVLGSIVSSGEEQALLLVRDATGYANLCQILGERHLAENFRLAQTIAEHQAGLFVLTPCPRFAESLARDLDPGRLWLELLRPAADLESLG